jgi:hypothetical protein
MLLSAEDSWFKLTIADYQFHNDTHDKWDSNWLIIDGSVRLAGRDWRFREPCLTNFEAYDLAAWLEDCVYKEPDKPYCSFTEPNLQFDLVDKRTIRVSFALESAPPWANQGDDWRKHGFNFSNGSELLKAAEDLRHQLQHFPVRSGQTQV